MSDELTEAKVKIALLEEKLETATTRKQETATEAKLLEALKRLDVLEKRGAHSKEKREDEEAENEGDQCPECGGELYDIGDGIYECSNCGEQYEDE